VAVVAAEVNVVLIKMIILLLGVVVVVTAVAVTKLLMVNTVARRTMLAAIVAAEADGTALIEVELTLLLDLVLLGNSKRVATVVLTLAVVRSRTIGTSAAARRVKTNGSSVVSGTTALLFVVGSGKLSFGADGIEVWSATNGRKIGRVNVVPQLGAVTRNLLHDNRVTELGEETVNALDGGIGDLALLQGTVHVPFLAHTTLDEVGDEFRANEVDKGISNVEVVGEIDAQVREVVVTLGGSVEEELQVFEVNTVGNVAQHDSCADVDTSLNLLQIDSLWLVPAPKLHVHLVDRRVLGKSPPVRLDTTGRVSAVTATETAGRAVSTGARSVLISVATSSVMVVTIIRLVKDSEILSSSHEVAHTMSSRVNVRLVASRLIGLNGHGDSFLSLLVNASIKELGLDARMYRTKEGDTYGMVRSVSVY
jgi:hypothetical protein